MAIMSGEKKSELGNSNPVNFKGNLESFSLKCNWVAMSAVIFHTVGLHPIVEVKLRLKTHHLHWTRLLYWF